MTEPSDKTLAVAERIAQAARELGLETAVIGAIALAVHGYPRATEDLDLAIYTDPFTTLRELSNKLDALGFHAELRLPDAEDPLGGVLTVTGDDFDTIQLINYCNPLTGGDNPGYAAIAASEGLVPGTSLRVANLAHLVALKLYAGGVKSKLDVVELLGRNPEAPRSDVREVCARYGLGEAFDALLTELEP